MKQFPLFPKNKPQLPKEYEDIYFQHLKKNRDGITCASWLTTKLENWMHKKVAADVINQSSHSIETLEIGAGTLNHLPFEKRASSIYDIIEPSPELYIKSPLQHLVKDKFNDIDDISDNRSYDRIISIATFEHICNLPEVVAKSVKLLNRDGVLRVAIPNEGSLFWYLGWKLTSAVEFKLKYGLDYSVLMKYEHINNAHEIEEILRYFFDDIKISFLGLTQSLSFYVFIQCQNPYRERAAEYIK